MPQRTPAHRSTGGGRGGRVGRGAQASPGQQRRHGIGHGKNPGPGRCGARHRIAAKQDQPGDTGQHPYLRQRRDGVEPDQALAYQQQGAQLALAHIGCHRRGQRQHRQRVGGALQQRIGDADGQRHQHAGAGPAQRLPATETARLGVEKQRLRQAEHRQRGDKLDLGLAAAEPALQFGPQADAQPHRGQQHRCRPHALHQEGLDQLAPQAQGAGPAAADAATLRRAATNRLDANKRRPSGRTAVATVNTACRSSRVGQVPANAAPKR